MSETAAGSELAAWTSTPTLEELEQRVQRLEDAVAPLCDTQALVERVRAEVVEQLRQEPIHLDARPMETAAAHDNGASLPQEAHPVDRRPASLLLTAERPDLSTLTLFGEIWWELRTVYAMVRDPLYRLSWMCRLAFVLPIVFILWHYFFTFLFYPLELIVFLCLAYFVLKVSGRELRRFQAYAKQRRGY
jgi:hypothetical protein